MSDGKVLTKEIAEQFLADEESVDLAEFTAIEDEAAEIIGLAAVHPFFVHNYTTSQYLWQDNGPCFDLSGVSNLSPNAISLLRPSLKELARAFSDKLITAVEEIRESGNDWLAKTEGIAVSGYNAIFGHFFSSPVHSPDDCLFIASDTVSGFDVFGEALKAKTLYYSLRQERFGDDGCWDDCRECLKSLIGECPMSCDSVRFDGDGYGDAGCYIPIERLCECLRESNWPHAGEPYPGPCSLQLGLKALTTDQARAIAEREGPVYLGDELERISEECAAILADGRAAAAFYWASIPATESQWKLVKRWGDKDNSLELYVESVSDEFADYIFQIGKSYLSVILGQVKEISDASLGSLVRIQGELGLGLTTLSPSQATILSQHNAKLSLYELVNISDETATLLSEFPYELYIEIDNLPESAAAILRKHPSFAESEDDDECPDED
jgi:hypothetical protein